MRLRDVVPPIPWATSSFGKAVGPRAYSKNFMTLMQFEILGGKSNAIVKKGDFPWNLKAHIGEFGTLL